jgi:hypothetical protein
MGRREKRCAPPVVKTLLFYPTIGLFVNLRRNISRIIPANVDKDVMGIIGIMGGEGGDFRGVENI